MKRDQWKVTVPEGESGDWKVSRFTIEKDTWQGLVGSRVTAPGTYTRLTYRDDVVMSDTDAEYRDHYELFCNARGRVLLHGLGIGAALQVLLGMPEVEHVDVVELSEDVLKLVGPHYQAMGGAKLTLHQGDALTKVWPKGTRWNAVWHDIWPSINLDNLEEMKTLHRKFGRKCDWQGSWSRYLCELARDRDRRYNPFDRLREEIAHRRAKAAGAAG